MEPSVGRENLWRSRKGIPIRNLWLLMFYASEFSQQVGEARGDKQKQPEELPDLVAEVLSHLVERRLSQNLTRGYVHEEAIRTRVRGRIDILRSESQGLLQRGQVACRYLEFTMDTPRNRYFRGALRHLAGLASTKTLRHQCQMLAARFEQLGVTGSIPKRREISIERFGRHDQQDRPMLAAAKLAFELKIPTEEGEREILPDPNRDEQWLRRLFERAVAGFYQVTLKNQWTVKPSLQQHWPVSSASLGAKQILPQMENDIWLEHKEAKRRVIIDTKFTRILNPNRYEQLKLHAEYLYQMYTYLRTQENSEDSASISAEGLLLHPAVNLTVDEALVIQGHRIRFATLDLSASAAEIRRQLLEVISSDEHSVHEGCLEVEG